jgi:hypothetical protein
VGINNKIYRFRNGMLVLQGQIKHDIQSLAYQSMKVYVLSVTGDVYGFEEGPRLRAVTVFLQ